VITVFDVCLPFPVLTVTWQYVQFSCQYGYCCAGSVSARFIATEM